MRTAIISDIHANLEALQAVLAHIDQQKTDRIICLGDILGYGPNPVECVDLIAQRCDWSLLGNHDFGALYELDRGEPQNFDILAVDAFSSDAIPTHLLTRQALRLYRSKLRTNGVLAFHISNRFLELEPEHLVPSHGPPISGKHTVHDVITTYRDAVQFVWDESVRAIDARARCVSSASTRSATSTIRSLPTAGSSAL